MDAGRTKHSAPRAVGGGRSPRYARRRVARGVVGVYAPEWSDAAAAAVLDALEKSSAGPRKVSTYCDTWLANRGAHAAFVAGLKISPADRALATSVIAVSAAKAQGAGSDGELRKVVKTFLKPLRERRAARTTAGELEVVSPASRGPRTFHAWLAKKPEKERMRSIQKSRRILDGVKQWPLGWLKGRGVVCYERAAGRVLQERGGRPDGAFLRGVVKQQELPTLTANTSDHYVVLAPKCEPRFMTVQEVMRSFGVPAQSSLWKALVREGLLTAPQAVSCLGRSVNVSVARQVVATLIQSGALAPGLSYGSAFSGIDTFAAAVEEETGGDFTYAFASEGDEVPRKGLLHAWRSRGLTAASCFQDARSEEAANAPPVDLYMTSPECTAHSRMNHGRNGKDQRSTLEDFWHSLAYVRAQRPAVVVVENVAEASSVGPMTGLLGRLAGYSMATAMLDPRAVAGMPVARERQYWVLQLVVGGRN